MHYWHVSRQNWYCIHKKATGFLSEKIPIASISFFIDIKAAIAKISLYYWYLIYFTVILALDGKYSYTSFISDSMPCCTTSSILE